MFETSPTNLAEQCECTICPKLLKRTWWLSGEVRRERLGGRQFYLVSLIACLCWVSQGTGSARAHPRRPTHVLGRDDPRQLLLVLHHQLVPSAEASAPLLGGGRDKAAVAAAGRDGEARPRETRPDGAGAPRGPRAATSRGRSPWRGGGPRRRRLRARPARPPAPRPARSPTPGPAPRRWPGPARGKRRPSPPIGRPPGRPGAAGLRAGPCWRPVPAPGRALRGAGGGGGGRRQRPAAAAWPWLGSRRRGPARPRHGPGSARLHRPGGGAAEGPGQKRRLAGTRRRVAAGQGAWSARAGLGGGCFLPEPRFPRPIETSAS